MNEHFWISDTQVKPDVYISHIEAAGNYIADRTPNVIIHGGDHWDMPSLSSYEKPQKKAQDEVDTEDDFISGLSAMELLMKPIEKLNRKRKRKGMRPYKPRLEFLMGNHEDRITRYTNEHTHLRKLISFKNFKLESFGWNVNPFLRPVCIDGVYYAHYFYMPNSGRAIGGNTHYKLNKLGFSFTMGHQQGKDVAEKYLNNGQTLRGAVAGSFYQHREDYRGYQANDHWHGCLYKHEVKDGNYCLLELSLKYLMREWL